VPSANGVCGSRRLPDSQLSIVFLSQGAFMSSRRICSRRPDPDCRPSIASPRSVPPTFLIRCHPPSSFGATHLPHSVSPTFLIRCHPPSSFGATHLPHSVSPTFLDSSPVGGAVRKCNLLSICPVELSMGLGNSIPRFLPYLPSFEVSLGRVADCVHLSILWMCP
jgi:hypothetical protein